ncbi:pancreas/duodenum homeobox protein 1 [Halodesulfovibrio marinisediminis]|uniref:Pancreas/duodenum homeobox protein 1 n=1 Tax=Halodesulfovibrio marinisediminis DSM 17456 TaxID=1121457 RepID=A0A1N6E1P1_9BACT|nr:pancreas/duodenum homeobox protein 1 [Halodesulfovibrio marinisediminis]SIN76904.1 hypothetical protein SAMN02745161_0640 [Halodesulfovibrio marinisediminis DSM 17456]
MQFDTVFTKEKLEELFPASKTDEFFDALYGEAESGAYDIELAFVKGSEDTLEFAFFLNQRNGACLACNLTYGLPQVFMRHPIINVKGLVEEIASLAGMDEVTFELGRTQEESSARHIIPLVIKAA